tara:strand:+ start:901 stop:1107 length:207 start_codon:yes stop_codon:yes gene_type:complete
METFTKQTTKNDEKIENNTYFVEKTNLEKIISEYRLTQNNFNPNKSSPPNKFMDKLEIRMKYYYSNNY